MRTRSWPQCTEVVEVPVRIQIDWNRLAYLVRQMAEEGLAVLGRACETVGLSAEGARLLRLGSNAVYRLRCPVVVRIACAGTSAATARRALEVARWLESVDYPAVRALNVTQPVITGGHLVTYWQAVCDTRAGQQHASIDQVAQVIARLHRLTPPEDLPLPPLDPFAKVDKRIAEGRWLSADDRSWMTTELARLRAEYACLDFALPEGVIHGDASIGNVLRGYHGNPVVIDLDDFAVGPREWDLIQTAIYYDRFGWHTSEEYEAFTLAYGRDLMRWSGYPLLATIQEFILTTWIASKAAEDERASAEARKRINALRTGSSRKDWNPF